MRLVIQKSVYNEIMKGFGKRDLSKLQKVKRTDKNGHSRYVYVKVGEEVKDEKKKATEEDVSTKTASKKPASSSISSTSVAKFTVGTQIEFQYGGNTLEGEIISQGAKGVQIRDKNGAVMNVDYVDISAVTKNSDGTVPASKFNANDYKKSFTDPKCTNDKEGIKHVYSLLGSEGADTQAMVEKKLYEQVSRMKKGDTQTRNTVNGEYTKERKALHEAIINSILSPEKIEACKPKNGEKPKFIMFGGRGGSGKSWFTDKKRAAAEGREVMFDSDNFLVLDADALKEYIPEYEGWNAGEVHEESSYLNKKIKAKAFELGINIIIDGTMNYNPKKPDKVRNEMLEAKDKGYSLEAHYMFAPIQKSCVNAMQRFKTKKGDYSGRLVPTDILLSMQDNEKSFDSVKDICDDWSFRDNQDFKAKLISKKGL